MSSLPLLIIFCLSKNDFHGQKEKTIPVKSQNDREKKEKPAKPQKGSGQRG